MSIIPDYRRIERLSQHEAVDRLVKGLDDELTSIAKRNHSFRNKANRFFKSIRHGYRQAKGYYNWNS